LSQRRTKHLEEGDLVSTLVRRRAQRFKYPDVTLTSAGGSQSERGKAIAEGDAQIKLLAAQLCECRHWLSQAYPGGTFRQRDGCRACRLGTGASDQICATAYSLGQGCGERGW
jgi:hypothetical protein